VDPVVVAREAGEEEEVASVSVRESAAKRSPMVKSSKYF
jgi:hypothetical protein